jgi:hypothetical protein
MRRFLMVLCVLAVLAVGCSSFEKAADDGAETVIENRETIERVTDVAEGVLPAPFNWIAGVAGGGLIAAAGAWIAYRQGQKKPEAKA